jgi:glycerophosphoryl diester phosphodiesterase
LLAAVAISSVPHAAAEEPSVNPWPARRILNMAHQGGEIEAPSNTLFAFKTAIEKGADVLELDVHATADRELDVWTINDRATMDWLVDIGADGIMTDRPTLLEQVLRRAGVRFEA